MSTNPQVICLLLITAVLQQLVVASTTCKLSIVESIPENLTYPSGSPLHESTFEGWLDILQLAKNYVNISSFYMTLNGSDTNTKDPSSNEGEKILDTLKNLGKNGVDIRIVQEITTRNESDAQALEKLGLAKVQYLNLSQFDDSGILHTKLILVDGKHMYVGSANMDWRSLTQVKELGLLATDCPELVRDAAKLFYVYWLISVPGAKVPQQWPPSLGTTFDLANPLKLDIGEGEENPSIFLSSSPAMLCPPGRTRDLDALIDVIRTAEQFVHVAVMDYLPAIIYSPHYRFWPVIDDELRRAAIERGVEVRIMGSFWKHTPSAMLQYLCSLAADSKIERYKSEGAAIQVKLFNVPSFTPEQSRIPFARVNHNKYMVTDKKGYIGTSNWTGDYFNGTAGVSATIEQDGENSLPQQLREIFLRDWNSDYASPIDCKKSVFL